MKNWSIGEKILAGVMATLGLSYMFYRYAMANYGFNFKTATITDLSFTNKTVSINLIFELSSRIGIQFVVKDIEADILLNGVKVAHISKTDSIVVPANGGVTIAIPLDIDLTQLAGDAIGQIQSIAGGNKNIHIVGSSSAYVSSLPVSVSVNIDQSINL